MMFCLLYKFAIEKDMDNFGSVQRPSLTRHLQTCSACRAFYQQMTRLEDQLRSIPSGEFSNERLERIRNVVRQRLSETAPAQSPLAGFQRHFPYHVRYAVSAAAVVLISLAGLLYLHSIRSAKQNDPMVQFIRNTTVLQNQVSVLARLPEQTFQTEMQKLANDAQSAMAFIVNCIPANPADMNPTQTRNKSTP